MTKELRSLSVWIATGLGAGYFPVAPGTAGSLVGVALVVVLRQTALDSAGLSIALSALALVLFLLTIVINALARLLIIATTRRGSAHP